MVGERLREGAAQVTPWIAASAFFAGVTTYYFHTAFTLSRRTGLLLAAMSVPAIANVGLCLALIPRFGLQGAMWATLASYMIGSGASFVLGRRVLRLPVPWDALAKAVLASALMAVGVAAVPAVRSSASSSMPAAPTPSTFAACAATPAVWCGPCRRAAHEPTDRDSVRQCGAERDAAAAFGAGPLPAG
jgi:O-antigen/teichoic acid export membrane protein